MGLILFVLIAIVAEILVWIFVGNLVGSGWYVFFWFIAAFFIGLSMLRSSTAHIMPQMQQMQMTGGLDASGGMGQHLPRAIAGFLLLVPGLLTDAIAVLMLLPPVQRVFRDVAMKAMQKRQQAMMDKMMNGMMGGNAQNPFADMMRQMQEMQRQQSGQDSTIIDGEAREITPESKRIDAPTKFKDVN